MKTKSIQTESVSPSAKRPVHPRDRESMEPGGQTSRRLRTLPLRILALLTLAAVFAVATRRLTAQSSCGCVGVNVYNGFEPAGGGAPYSDLIGSLQTTAVSFGTDTGFDWHPFGASEFGADIT